LAIEADELAPGDDAFGLESGVDDDGIPVMATTVPVTMVPG